MRNNLILKRIAIPLSPLLSFVFVIAVVFFMKAEDVSAFMRYISLAHIFGAIPGIAMGVFFSISRQGVILKLTVVLIGVIILFSVLGYLDWLLFIIVVSSFIATFFDLLYKKFFPEYIYYSRLLQSALWIFSLILIVFNGADLLYSILMRSVCLIAGGIGLFKVVKFESNCFNAGKLLSDFAKSVPMYLWMMGSNSIFISSAYIQSSFDSFKAGVVAYLLNVSLQIAGRFSDYIQSSDRLGVVNSKVEFSLVFLGVLFFLTISFLIKMNSWEWIIYVEVAIFCLVLAFSVMMWALADARVALMFYRDEINGFSWIATVLSIFSVLGFFCLNFLSKYNESPLLATIPVFLGSLIYLVISRKY